MWLMIIAVMVSVAVAACLPLLIPTAGFAYTNWQIKQMLSSVSEEELINRTKDLPEVKAYLALYPNPVMNIDKDYHIGVDYSSTSCAYHKKYCDSSEAVKAELMVRINLSTGYPQNSAWGCNGSLTISPLSDPVLIDEINRGC